MKYKVKDIRGVVPSYEGFYFVYNSLEEMIYIGTSKNISKRLNDTKIFQRFLLLGVEYIQFVPCNINRLEIEKNLIKLFAPIGNSINHPNYVYRGRTKFRDSGRLDINITDAETIKLFIERKKELEYILNKKLKNSKVVEILTKIYLEELERQRNA